MFHKHDQRFARPQGYTSVAGKRFMAAFMLLLLTSVGSFAQTAATVNVSGTQAGISTKYMGMQGNGRETFDVMDDLNANSWRYYMGMDPYEPADDKPGYGSPSISQLKAASVSDIINTNNLINWSVYQTELDDDKGDNQTPAIRFKYFKDNGIRVFGNLRPQHKGGPSWAPSFETLTQNDKNEWWQFVYAMVLIMNKKNDFQIHDWEIGNEPNLPSEGYKGTKANYYEMVRLAKDAIETAYSRHLNNQAHRIYAPATAWDDANWIPDVIAEVGDDFDHVSYHKYTSYDGLVQSTKNVNAWAGSNREVWLTEWGTWWTDFNSAKNSDLPINIQWLKFIMSMSTPGNTYVDGWHYYKVGHSGYGGGDGLVDYRVNPGKKEKMYYGLRMGIRALNGGKPVFTSTTSDSDLSAITSRNSDGTYSVLVTNTSSNTTYNVELNLSALVTSKANGTLYRFDASNNDSQSQGPAISSTGRATISIPPNGAFQYITNSTSGSGGGGTTVTAFQQASTGLVSMEAENYSSKVDRGTHAWTVESNIEGDSGPDAMKATPDNGTNITSSIPSSSPELKYTVNFVKTGTHYIWIRGYAANSSAASAHTGLDGALQSNSDAIETATFGSWVWIKDTRDGVRASINVGTTGVHTFSVYMREDGFVVDKVVLTTDANYVPSNLGPDESAKGNVSARVATELKGVEGATDDLIAYPVPASDQLTVSYWAAKAGKVTLNLIQVGSSQSVMSVERPVVVGKNLLKMHVGGVRNTGSYVLQVLDGGKAKSINVQIGR